jgi:hypothetical protein
LSKKIARDGQIVSFAGDRMGLQAIRQKTDTGTRGLSGWKPGGQASTSQFSGGHVAEADLVEVAPETCGESARTPEQDSALAHAAS